jgi:hypothetical protein
MPNSAGGEITPIRGVDNALVKQVVIPSSSYGIAQPVFELVTTGFTTG